MRDRHSSTYSCLTHRHGRAPCPRPWVSDGHSMRWRRALMPSQRHPQAPARGPASIADHD
eukprot:7118787-Alexandrium_andersonii.AAC.1